ncbi:InlB B-repeat-containing protein [Soonwooa sp.]|uniref:InlB B-repeat-containing protein n=1 Tax=Soonwooa sp. TaxID=1938592 RepID=UPI0035B160EB
MEKNISFLRLLVIAFFSVLSTNVWGQTFQQITSATQLTDGEYLIVGDGTSNDGIMLNTTGSGPFINYTSVTNPGATISSGYTSANIFTIAVVGSDITIFNSSVGYVSWGNTGTGTGNNAGFFNGTPTDKEKWTFSVASNLWTLTNKATPARFLQWNNGSPRFACYSNGSQVNLKLYKKAGKVVTYKGNSADGGGTGNTGGDYTQSSSITTNLSANTFTRTGYSFSKWNTVSTGGGVDYANGASYDFSADMTLYAQWLINQYNVVYDANGGVGTAPVTQTADYNTNVIVSNNTFTRTGYNFSGWNTAANGTGTNYAEGAIYTIPASNTTMYAQWVLASPLLSHTGTNITNHGTICPSVAAAKQTYTVSNTGGVAATGVTITSSNPEFSISNISNTTIGANGGKITYDVIFTPTSGGSKSAQITVNSTEAATTSNSLIGIGITPVLPVVTTNVASNVANTAARLNANYSVSGQCPSVIEKGFVYSLSSNNNDPLIGGVGVTKSSVSGVGTGSYSIDLPSLSSNSEYSYKAYVYNGTSYIYGYVQTVTTLARASQLVFNPGPPANGTSGVSLTTFKIEARRPNNSVDTEYTGAVTLSKINVSGSGNLTGTLTTNAIAGVATFNNIQIDAAGTYKIVAISTNIGGVTSNDVVIAANPANGYYRSKQSGSWTNISTWEASVDGVSYVAATTTPTSVAKTISIRNGHNVSIDSNINIDQVVIEDGGVLSSSNTFTLNDGVGDDIIIQSGGTLEHTASNAAASFSGSSTISVETGGRILMTGGSVSQITSSASNYIFKNASVLEWPQSSAFGNTIYFPNVDDVTIPILRISGDARAGAGINSPLVVNGVLEVTGSTSFTNSNKKTFRNGIRGSGTVTQTGSHEIVIDGKTAELGGGSLTLATGGLSINTATVLTLISNKVINSGRVTNNGTMKFAQYVLSGTGSFTQAATGHIMTSNSGGVGGSVALSGTNSFSANGAGYTFDGNTTTPFVLGGSTNFKVLNINANVDNNIAGASTIVTEALNVNNNGYFALNSAVGSDLNLSNANGELNVAEGGAFDNGGENKITSSGGSPRVIINGNFVNRDKDGFTGTNTVLPSIVPTLGDNSTIIYGLEGNQDVTAFAYKNLTFSNGGTKTLVAPINNVKFVLIKDNTIVDTGTRTFGGTATSLTMQDTSWLKTGGSDTKPDIGGIYTLSPTSTIEFVGASATNIRLAPLYSNVVISGSNVGISTATGGLTLQSGSNFHVTNTGVFKVINTNGFSGGTNTAIKNTNTPSIVLDPLATIDYAGASQIITTAQPSTPSDAHYQNLRISGSGVKTASGTTKVNNIVSVVSGELKVAETVDNAAPNALYAKKGLQNNGGVITLANNAVLMQDVDASNIGSIGVERQAHMRKMDYTYWSSPVAGQKLLNNAAVNDGFSVGTPNNRIYYYDEATDYLKAIPTSETHFVPGKGYAIRGKDGFDPDTETANLFKFGGVPNNGDAFTVTVQKKTATTGGYNLIGNPYPSNLDFVKFFNANSGKISGKAWFWTNVPGAPVQQQGAGYYDNFYATITLTGGTPPTQYSGAVVQNTPTQYVKLGQGFIVEVNNVGPNQTLNFSNDMRSAEAGVFFNDKNNQSDRFWLEMEAPNASINTILLGYVQGATNAYDRNYDAELFGEPTNAFYSFVDQSKMQIQGRQYPLDLEDRVRVGVRQGHVGQYIIRLGNREGAFGTQSIYLRDKLLHKEIDLTKEQYIYTSQVGEFNDRFEIAYQESKILDTDNVKALGLKVYRNNNDFVGVTDSIIEDIELYDMGGKLLLAKKLNDKTFKVSSEVLANGVYIIKTKTKTQVYINKIRK